MYNNIKKGIVAVALTISTIVSAQDALAGDINKGKEVFDKICSACHKTGERSDVKIGPGLKGVYGRLTSEENLDLAWMQTWIKNSQDLVTAGDPYANKVFKEFGETVMTKNPVSDQDVIDVLTYLEDPAAWVAPVEEEVAVAAPKDNTNSTLLLVGFLAFAGVLLAALLKLKTLVDLKQHPDLKTAEADKIKSFSDFYGKFEVLANIGLGIFLLVSLYGTWAFLMGIGVDKGYAPDQPIYFSHKIHAGENGIDCQTCHSGAKYGKVSEIPSANVCMNCHKNIPEYKGKYVEPGKTKEFYTAEIKKLYDHVGWNGSNYTGETKPIKWTRIHNMPDFVYFNHSQHVVAGEKTIIKKHNEDNPDAPIDVVCKACHGAIDTMNVVQMANDFTMDFCINCHRKTEVDMTNGYNSEYFKNLHAKLAKGKSKEDSANVKITVDAIGGIECGKCHY